MAKNVSAYDGFSRSKRRDNGVRSSYAGMVSKNAARKSYSRLRSIIIYVLLCLLLPPFGIYFVCADDERGTAFKAVCCGIATCALIFVFSLMIPNKQPATVSVSKVAPKAIEQVVATENADSLTD